MGHERATWRTSLLSLALALSSLAVAVLLGEALVRLFSPIGPALLVTDAGVGKRFVPGFEGRVFVDEVGREVALRFNSAGFRGPEWSKARPAGTLRVAVLGDSMTAAIATDEEKTFVRQLEARLGGSGAAQVMNVGVSSASTGAELLTWRRGLSPYGPDVVLLAFFTGNDFGDNCSRLTSAPRVYFELDGQGQLVPGSEPGPTSSLTRFLDRSSRLYVWQKVAFRQLRGRTRASGIEPGQRIFAEDDGPDTEYAWRLTEALVRQIRDEVEVTGARFGLVVIPCAEQVDDELWADLVRRGEQAGHRLVRDAPSRRLAAIAERSGIRILDLLPAFGEAARGSNVGLFLLGRFHLSDEGNRVVAEALHPFVGSLMP